MDLRRALVAALIVLPGIAAAAAAGEPITAVRRQGPIVIDGKVDEDAWAKAPLFDGFIQNFPNEGAAPTEQTEVRVVYDDRNLYIGMIARDRDPKRILRPLGRRDSAPYSDMMAVVIDPMRDGRLGYYFEVTAAGVQSDALVFQDDSASGDWDAVWDGVATELPDGWSVEMRIPLSAMRFTDAHVQTWGFGVKRLIGWSHEEDLTVLMPRGSRGDISRLGPLVGLADMQPVPELEVTPYIAARVDRRPLSTDTTLPLPRVTDPIGNVGFDLRASLGRSMALNATVNPDFGQVEADQIIQNLSTFEAFFPEKRPFFLQGMDLFQPVKLGGHESPQQLFYSRRIGLDAPILGAAKLTGRIGDGVQIGVLESVVTGASDPLGGDDYRFSWKGPLRFGPQRALPEEDPASRNFLVGVAKWQPEPNRTFGASVASALPLGSLCTQAEMDQADAADVDPPPHCTSLGGNAGALDAAVRSRDNEWFMNAQASGSQAEGGPPERTLADGTQIKRGDAGYGGFFSAGRSGGRGLRGEVHWQYESPMLDLNPTGFQRTQNESFGRLFLTWAEPKGGGPFHQWDMTAGTERAWTTDGRGLERWGQVWWNAEAQTRGFTWMGCVAAADLHAWDVREIYQSGHAQERPTTTWANCWFETDNSNPVVVNMWGNVSRTVPLGPMAAQASWATGVFLSVRPHPRFETRIQVGYEDNRWPARYVDDDVSGNHVFANLHAPDFSVTLRQQVVLTPKLTLQAYAQIFTQFGSYSHFYLASPQNGRVAASDLVPLEGGAAAAGVDDPDFREGALNVNVVLRWEYRAGSTLFLVYTRAQQELGHEEDGYLPPHSLQPQQLGRGPTTDTFLVKWTYYWNP